MVEFHRNHGSTSSEDAGNTITPYATIFTQFWPPNSFATPQEQNGSFSQLPSAKKRYSYLPVSRERVAFHVPFLSFFIGFAWVFQWLKLPARETSFASGADISNLLYKTIAFKIFHSRTNVNYPLPVTYPLIVEGHDIVDKKMCHNIVDNAL